jgi:hypothetical protein
MLHCASCRLRKSAIAVAMLGGLAVLALTPSPASARDNRNGPHVAPAPVTSPTPRIVFPSTASGVRGGRPNPVRDNRNGPKVRTY